jgi:hypothetical protein
MDSNNSVNVSDGNLQAILEAISLVCERGSGYGAVVIKIEKKEIKEITAQSSIRPLEENK